MNTINLINVLTENGNLMNQILGPILAAVGTALAGAITFGITRLIAWINTKIGNEKLAEAITILGDVIQAAVDTTNQTFVEQLKKDGKFDKNAQKEAFNKTMDTIKGLLTKEARDILEANFGDIEAYITIMIEKVIVGNKW